MDDFAKTLGTNWPLLVFGTLALAAVFLLLKSSISSLRSALETLRQEQEKLHARLTEADRRTDAAAQQQAALAARIEQTGRELEAHRLATNEALRAAAASRSSLEAADQGVACPADSLERFNAAADALAQVAKELEGLDSRQAENWLRIKGDLDEQTFALQRVQQHVDQLFAPPGAAALR